MRAACSVLIGQNEFNGGGRWPTIALDSFAAGTFMVGLLKQINFLINIYVVLTKKQIIGPLTVT
jgi:hypothetical protein